ncbi:MAG: hypothetical protein NZ530_00855 [Thermodesulfobacteriaceae bacterium]|nr:hypothetical protein [Thermodesulfobacteriaceae bacterium]MCX8042176.1 hypothetical protein [Thermodesulfobacteriaceae bacterium]MDW8136502.1 (Fe-S)-binding protein [Thermodesulfobacterium sp.]
MLLREPPNQDIILERALCQIPRCSKSSYQAKLALEKNLLFLLPYLRAKAKTLYFEPNKILVFKWLGKEKNYEVALSRDTLAIEFVEDREEALEVFNEVIKFINQVWKERDQIIPNLKPFKKPPVLELYKYLPKTNCKVCGEETCLAFATKLVLAEREVEACPELVKKPEILKLFKELVE